jgi:SAM-dependent methyltransferase
MRHGLVLFGMALVATTALAQQTDSPGQQWDERFKRPMFLYGKEPVEFLKQQEPNLRVGRALCLAAGEGRNAVFLAQQGFDVVAVDASAEGLAKANALASERGVTIETKVADLRDYDLGVEQYDLVTDFYYHQPDLFPKAMRALKPGGFFVLQGFSIDQPNTSRFGPKNPDFLIKAGELLQHFDGYRIRYYEDTVVELDEGMHQGSGAVVRLVVEKVPLLPVP